MLEAASYARAESACAYTFTLTGEILMFKIRVKRVATKIMTFYGLDQFLSSNGGFLDHLLINLGI